MAELTPIGSRLSEALLPRELAPRELLRAPAVSRWNALRGVRVGLTVSVLLLLMIGANLATPLYPALQRSLHLTSVDTTVLFTVYVFALIPVLLAVGHWSDHLGRRAMVLPAVALAAGGDLIFASAHSLTQLAVGRAIQGVAVGLTTAAAGAALADLLPDQPSAAAKLTLAASAGGVALGPLLGATLAVGSNPLVTPFVTHAIALLVLCVPLPGPAPSRAGPGTRRPPATTAPTSPARLQPAHRRPPTVPAHRRHRLHQLRRLRRLPQSGSQLRRHPAAHPRPAGGRGRRGTAARLVRDHAAAGPADPAPHRPGHGPDRAGPGAGPGRALATPISLPCSSPAACWPGCPRGWPSGPCSPRPPLPWTRTGAAASSARCGSWSTWAARCRPSPSAC